MSKKKIKCAWCSQLGTVSKLTLFKSYEPSFLTKLIHEYSLVGLVVGSENTFKSNVVFIWLSHTVFVYPL